MNALSALAGGYRVSPGRMPALAGGRPVVQGERLRHWLRGRRGADVVSMLGQLFSVCAHAHRLVARLALAAAAASAGRDMQASAQERATLELETARDHLRTLALDWPAHFGAAPADLGWLAQCPVALVAPGESASADAAQHSLQALHDWWERAVLHQDPAQWLQACATPGALVQWCTQAAPVLPPARCLHQWATAAQALESPCVALRPLRDGEDTSHQAMRRLGQAMLEQPDFAAQPLWLGRAAETGPWVREHNALADAPQAVSAWQRLSARWTEAVALSVGAAASPSRAMLSCGSVALEAGQAVAWCEMARGLLLHAVCVDANGAVQDYRVVAPTDWNFSPRGALAQTLATLRPTQTAQARLLTAAYDACVPCLVASDMGSEVEHA